MAAGSAALIVYSTQVLILVCVATVTARLCRLAVPAVRLAYWRGVAALCLALPFLATPQSDTTAVSRVSDAATVGAATGNAASPLLTNAGIILLWIWAAGTVARLAWLLLGAVRLRHIRTHSTPAAPDAAIDALRRAIAPQAELRWAGALTQPVTFGVRSPVVVLPASFDAIDPEAQRAVVCHELLHAARRDWLWVVAEEHVRALFWFHPAMWWVLDQVDLSREQLIDRRVVALTGSRKPYMEALLTFADARRVAAPSLAFLKRHHLKFRLRQLAKEPHMSRTRLAWTTTALAAAMAAATSAVVTALPLDIPPFDGQRHSSGAGIRLFEADPASGSSAAPAPAAKTARGQAPRRPLKALKEVQPEYPKALMSRKVQGVVIVESTIDTEGRPQNVRAISGPDALREAAVNAARQWRFEPPDEPTTVQCEFRFTTTRSRAVAVSKQESAPASSNDPDVLLPVVITEIRPSYTQAALRAGLEGDVGLSAVVEADGTVGDVKVTKSLDITYGLDEQAVAAVRQWRFQPGTKNGAPVAVSVDIQVHFALE